VAKLVPYNLDTTPRQLGVGRWHGQIWMAEDFDQLPESVFGSAQGLVEIGPDFDDPIEGFEADVPENLTDANENG
jgi:hypothetical protein